MIPLSKLVEKRCADAQDLPYADNTFDTVVSFDVIEHIENDQQAVNEILRILKPSGYFVISVHAFNALYSADDRSLGHFRHHTKTTVRKLSQQFNEDTIGYWMFFLFFPPVIKRFLARNQEKPYVSVPISFINKFFAKVLLMKAF